MPLECWMPEQAYSIQAFLHRHTQPQQVTEAQWLLEQPQHTKYPASGRNLILKHAGHKSDKTEPRASSIRAQLSIYSVDGAPGEIRTPDPLLRRQMLYPAELRAHPWLLFDSTAVATLIRVPTFRRFLEHLEQVHQIRRQRSPLPGGGS